MRYLIIVMVTCLVGCATQELNEGLQQVVGQPIDVLVNDWGYPSEQREIMGQTLYVWTNDNGVMAMPTYGGGAYAARLTCTIQVAVNDKNIITSYQWSGNNGGCGSFANRIAH